MSAAITSPPPELERSHILFRGKSQILACLTTVVALVIITSAIILFSSTFIGLTLGEAHAWSLLVPRAMIPSGIGLLAAIPIVLLIVRETKERTQIREKWVEKTTEFLTPLSKLSKEKRIESIKKDVLFFAERMPYEYSDTFIKEVKKNFSFEERKEPAAGQKKPPATDNEKICKSLDKALKELHPIGKNKLSKDLKSSSAGKQSSVDI